MAQSRGETEAHRNLKRAALFWAQVQGYSVAGMEVRVPASNYRADVAAYRPQPGLGEELGHTAVFECKQSRPDFLKDRHELEASLGLLAELNERRLKLERQLGIHHPSLRCGDALFQEYESVDLSSLKHNGYQKVVKALDEVQRRIYGKTKFDRMVRWRCANLLYLVVPEGLMNAEELPPAWGILVLSGKGEEEKPVLTLLRKPRWNEVPLARRLDLLQRIGASGTRLTNQAVGLPAEEIWEARSRTA